MALISPSILSADFMHLKKEVDGAEEAGADLLHIDVMDGHFVPNLTIGHFLVSQIKKSSSRLPLDVHIMMERPDRYLDDFLDAGADILTVHIEAERHLERTVRRIKDRGIKAGVALNPSTALSSLEDILYEVDMVVLMSVNPGFGGQKFIPHSLDKIKRLKEAITAKGLKTTIEVDGGVTVDNAASVVRAGADVLVMGSAFYNSPDYRKTIASVRANVAPV